MTGAIDWSDVEGAARALAGNHRKFECFAWHDRPEDDGKWAIVYTRHRDSPLLELSNAAAIARELTPFLEADEPDVYPEHADHFPGGWIDGYSIRVFDTKGEVTPAFRKWCAIQEELSAYPVLDEDDLGRRELDDTLSTIVLSCRRHVREDAPTGWEEQVYDWLSEHEPGALGPRDGWGADLRASAPPRGGRRNPPGPPSSITWRTDMGWHYCHSWRTKGDVIKALTDTPNNYLPDLNTLARSCCGNVLWAVQQAGDAPPVIACYLLERKGAWGYKAMCESMHPFYYSCPLPYLGLAPETDKEWRGRVREHHARKRELS